LRINFVECKNIFTFYASVQFFDECLIVEVNRKKIIDNLFFRRTFFRSQRERCKL